MYNFYSDSEDLFKNAVTAEDVLKIYRNINNINLCDENVVALENKLLINSFCRNHFLYSNKFLYYKLSMVLNDMCLLNDNADVINEEYNDLLNKIKNIVENNFNNVLYLKEKIDKELIQKLYDNLVDNTLSSSKDITKVHKSLNNDNFTTSEVMKLENNLFINKFYKNKVLFSNKFIYYKIVSIIRSIGLNTNNVNLINETFETIVKFTKLILSSKDIDALNKIEMFNSMCFEYLLLDTKTMNEYEQNLISINQNISNYEDKNNNFYEEKSKNKILAYNINKAYVS